MRGDVDSSGQFINLQAFTECAALRQEGARLPDWRTVRDYFPQLVRPMPDDPRHRLFITHRWDDPEYPDPTGWQLRALQGLGEHYNYQDPEFCFWLDYMSLPQKPREVEEEAIFSRGLDNIRRIVSACDNITLVSRAGADQQADLDAMRLRGWIVFELFLARRNFKIPLPLLERHGARVQHGRYAQHDWDSVVPDINTLFPFENVALIHTWFERKGITCTDGRDLKKLSKLLHRELTEKRKGKPTFQVRFGVEMRLTQQELDTLEIMTTSGLSGCCPRLFLVSRRIAPGRSLSAPPVWLVTFVKRPPMPPLDTWINCRPADLAAYRISPETLQSPMYPGIAFELDEDRGRMRATMPI